MSGGQLVVMDRSGRDVKRYSLPEGLVTLGSDPDCDIRVLLPAIKQHHATVVVHANQTIVRNVSDGETLVNGHVVSVAALRHGDVITLGDRSLRWEYYEPTVPRPLAPEPALHVKRKAKSRGRKRGSEVALRKIEPAVRLALEMKHRTSTPGGTKQVAIVQPQRRAEAVNTMETKTRLVTKPHRPYTQNKKAQRATKLSTSRESRTSRKRMTQSDLNTSHITEAEVRYSSIETDASVNENKSNTKSRKTKSPRNDSIRNKTMAEDTSSRNVTPKQASNITDDSDKMGTKSKTQNSDSPKNKTPKIRSSKSNMNMSSNTLLEDSTETKASQWIASRKTSPRKSHTPKSNEAKSVKYVHVATPRPKEPYVERSPSKMLASSSPIKVVPKRTPLRTVVLKKMLTPNDQNKSLRLSARKTQSAPKTRVLKIEEPLYLDDNKKAALMLLTRGSKSNTNVKPKTPVLVIKKPVKTTPKKLSDFERKSKGTPKRVQSPNSSIGIHSGGGDSRERRSRGKTVTRNSTKILTDDSVNNLSLNGHSEMIDEGSLSPSRNQILSPLLPSPKKSAMKDPSAKRDTKKIESIKFDLSNIESSSHEVEHKESSIVHETSNVLSETEDLTLRYSESPPPTPSPRRSIHSRSSRIMEKSLGETFSINSSENDNPVKSITPSLNTRKSLRSSLIVEKALNTSLDEITATQKTSRNKSQRFTMPVDASLKRNTSEKNKSLNNMETYSIVDLVSLNTSETGSVIDLGSVEANESAISSSMYDSAASDRTSISAYHSSAINESQRSSPRRKTYSLMQSHIGTSTPYVGKVTPRKSFLAKRRNKSESEMLNSPLSNNTSLKKSKSLINSSYQGSHSQTYDNDTNISVETTKQGDTFTITSSPRSTSRKKSSNASFTTSNLSQSKTLRSSPRKCKSKQSGSNTSLIAHGINEEPSTPPENVITTSEPSTPILNIQHLLNSSNMLIKDDYKAHKKGRILSKLQTVGPSIYKRKRTLVTRSICTDPKKGTRLSRVPRATLKSAKKTLLKRLNNDSSCASSKTDENAPEDDNEEKVTPKSTMVLVQPGVKEIHSTAKKPVSRRSIIDDLSESVIVKQLFNSPVKRKLSQSMTEFSKTEFTEDSTIRGKRKCATVGTTTRTPNQTLDLGNVNTPQVPTEVFISPITTPSPKLDGLKRLFANRTPDNDLRNVRGIKRLLRTPRKQKSPQNDLTNVLGVKETFSKRSPANDLTNVTGVKDLYRLKRSKTRISGVRSPLQLNKSGRSPKNDLTDVQGVKRLFTMEESKLQRKKPKKGVSPTKGKKEILVSDLDISDDEELFEGPPGIHFSPNSTFDKLVGKPQIKSTYSKSLRAKSKTPTKHSKATQSFHEPINFWAMNVEEWLEQELHRKTQKETSGVSRAGDVSKNVSINRELQKLTTDTLEGRTPILKSRVRSTAANKSQIPNTSRRSDQKRLSNLDRNSLPIKKRSIVNVSVALKENPVHRKSSLPIKKRSVIHSTPVANRYTLASNVSELERVSPITVDKQDGNLEVFHVNISITTPTKGTSIQSEPKSPKTRNQQKQLKDATPENKRTRRARAPKLKTPVSPRARRTRGGAKVADIPITKNVRTSLVIPKKPPVMSPNVISAQKASPRALRRGRKIETETNAQLLNKSIAGKESHVKLTRGTRSRRIKGLETEQDIEKDVTVKNQRETRTRARDKRNSLTPAVIVTKPSPKMKPQSKKTASKQGNKKSPVEEKKEPGRRTRKTGNEVDKIEKPVQGNARSTRRTENIESARRDRKILAAKSSPRSSKASVPKPEAKRSLRARNNILSPNIKTVPSKNVKEPKERKQEKGRKRTTNDMAASEQEVVPRKTRRTVGLAVDAVPKKETRKTRKTVETTLQTEKKSKGRSRKIKESPKKNSSKKEKKDTSSVVQEKLSKGRKRNVEIAELGTSTRERNTVKQQPTKRQRKGVEEKATVPSPAKTRLTRNQNKVVQVEGAGAKRRGRK